MPNKCKPSCAKHCWNGPVYRISALTGQGTQELLLHIQEWLDAQREREQREQEVAQGTWVSDDPRFDGPFQKNTDPLSS